MISLIFANRGLAKFKKYIGGVAIGFNLINNIARRIMSGDILNGGTG